MQANDKIEVHQESKVELKQDEKAVNIADMDHILNALAPSERRSLRRNTSFKNYNSRGYNTSSKDKNSSIDK